MRKAVAPSRTLRTCPVIVRGMSYSNSNHPKGFIPIRHFGLRGIEEFRAVDHCINRDSDAADVANSLIASSSVVNLQVPYPHCSADCEVVRRLAQQPVTRSAVARLMSYVADSVKQGLLSSSSLVCVNASERNEAYELETSTAFAIEVVFRSGVSMSTILGARVYADRARSHIRIAVPGTYVLAL